MDTEHVPTGDSNLDAVANDYITPKQAADLKGVTVGAIYKAIERGHIEGAKVLDRVAVKASEIAAWQPATYTTTGGAVRQGVSKTRGTNGGRPAGSKNGVRKEGQTEA